LGFTPLDDETIRIIGRLRHLTRKQFFDRRDLETLQLLIDELIHHQRLETFSREQFKRIIGRLRLDRPLGSKARAFTFIEERIPRRAVKYQVISSPHASYGNVFDIWRERERRSRLSSRDSLEDEIHPSNGQQLRDVTEINHPTPPVFVSATSNGMSKVKQMAKDIDTRSNSSRFEIVLRATDRRNDSTTHGPQSSPPIYSNSVSVALYDVKSPNQDTGLASDTSSENRSRTPHEILLTDSMSPASSEPSRVQQIIDRLESSSPPSAAKRQVSSRSLLKKSLHDEHSDGCHSSTSSPPVKRLARRDTHQANRTEAFIYCSNGFTADTNRSPIRRTSVSSERPRLSNDHTVS
jgi:hypothetical protein